MAEYFFSQLQKESKLFIWLENDQLKMTDEKPPKLEEDSNGFYYFIKKEGEVNMENVSHRIIFGTLEGKVLDNLLETMNNHYIPEFTIKSQPWPESVRKDFIS